MGQGELSLRSERFFIVFTAVLASLLEIIDTSIVNVAIPSMMGNLGATLEDISWVVTGYIIANAIVLPLSGWLSQRIGRRKYYVGCILLFTLTSVACGLAPDLLTLTIFRILQGLAGGALLPTSQTLIQEQFPREKAGTGSAIYGMSVMIGPTIGPTLGGWLTDEYGWRSIFNINLPLGLLAAFLAFRYVKSAQTESQKSAVADAQNAPARKDPIDSIGLALLCVGIGCLQFVLERGQADDWFASSAIVTCAILAAITLPAFVIWELRVPAPIINIRLFSQMIVRSGTLLMAALGFVLYGLIFILPIFVGRILHYDATQTGLIFMPGALLTAFCMPFIGMQLRKRDPRLLIGFGILGIECTLWLVTRFGSMTDDRQIFWMLIMRGLSMGFLFVPINATVLGHFKGRELGQVAGLLNLSRQIGGSLGIALIGTLLDRNSHQNYIDMAGQVSLLNPATQQALQGSAGHFSSRMPSLLGMGTALDSTHAPLRAVSQRLETQVFLMSFDQMAFVMMGIFALAVIPLVLLKVPKTISKEALESH